MSGGRFPIDFLEDYSDDAILEEVRRLAATLGKTSLSRRDVDATGRISSATLIKRFGSMRHALQRAGLRPVRFMKASDTELLDLLVELWVRTLEETGRRPYRSDLSRLGYPVSSDTIVRRFGPWRKALLRAASHADAISASESTEPRPAPGAIEQPGPRRSLSVRKRFFVLKRDNYRCVLCGVSAVPLEVDHIVPAARGGSDRLDNLQTLCVPCNRGKRDSLE
jgi:Homing endonuclease associated repeat/HNH endonuclease